MTLKYKIIVSVFALSAAFAFGRFTTPTKTLIQTKVVEVEKVKSKTNTAVKTVKHKTIKIIAIKKPDGTQETTTTVTEDNNSGKDTLTNLDSTTDQKQETKKEITKDSSKTSISVLAGANPFNQTTQPGLIYGAHVTRDLIGPISIGVFGLSNGDVGCSVGLTL